MDGIFVVDKPSGPTSHDICQYFKRELKIKKIGHAGTLDPLATGVLILLTGGATKLQSIFLGKDKEYEFTMRLGVATDTYDSQGKIVSETPLQGVILSEPIAKLSAPVAPEALIRAKNLLASLLPQFTGEILQKPPAYSALKRNGRPLYQLARQGETVVVAPRPVTIYSLEIMATQLPDITLKARCSSGTYVRSIAHDLGQQLGCGAHITALRRLRSEPFGIEDAVSI